MEKEDVGKAKSDVPPTESTTMQWTEHQDDMLTDLLFDTNYTITQIANEIGVSEVDVNKEIRNLGLSWVRRKKGHISRGQSALVSIMSDLIPGEEIRVEEPIGERLRLDVYCPKYELAAEYHGRQHFEYVPFFHGDKQGFLEAQQRDERKIELCKDLGIALVVFKFCDNLTQDTVYSRLLEALRNTPMVIEEKPSRYKGNAFYEASKKRRREYQRDLYRRMKARKGRG